MLRLTQGLMLFALACSPSTSWAQGSFVLLGEDYRDVSSVLADIGQKSTLSEPADPANDGQLYYRPFFAFRVTDQGQLDVRIFDIGSGRSRLAMFLLVSPASKVAEMARLVRAEEERSPVIPRFANVQQSQLIQIAFQSLHIRQDGPPIIFTPVRTSTLTLQDVIELRADLSTDQAVLLQQLLLDRKASFSFVVDFDLNARFTASETAGTFKSITLQETSSIQELQGSGQAFTLKTGASGIQVGPSIVTRRQRARFLGELKNELETTYSVENAKDLELVRTELAKYIDFVFGKPREIAIGPTFAAELSRVSGYKFPSADLQPDVMNKFVADWKSVFQKEEDKMTDAATAGSFEAFEVFGASGSASYKSKEYRKELEDIGWKFDLMDGKIAVPRALEVFDVDEKRLAEAFNISVKVTQRSRGLARMSSLVSTESNRLNPASSTNTLLRMEEFMNVTKSTIARIEQEARDTRKALPSRATPTGAEQTADGFSKNINDIIRCPDGHVMIGLAHGTAGFELKPYCKVLTTIP